MPKRLYIPTSPVSPLSASVAASIAGLLAAAFFVYLNIAPNWLTPGDAPLVLLRMTLTMIPSCFVVVLPIASWEWLFPPSLSRRVVVHLALGGISGVIVFRVVWGHLGHIPLLVTAATLTGAVTGVALSVLRRKAQSAPPGTKTRL